MSGVDNLKSMAERLRRAAAALDALYQRPGTEAVAKQIVKRTEPIVVRVAPRKKPHWTQLPKNRARMRKQLRDAAKVWAKMRAGA
jgi:hypothetical protein